MNYHWDVCANIIMPNKWIEKKDGKILVAVIWIKWMTENWKMFKAVYENLKETGLCICICLKLNDKHSNGMHWMFKVLESYIISTWA